MNYENFTSTILPIVQDVQTLTFSWYDYVLFCSMVAISALIGLYFGCFGQKQETTNDYLLGGKKMSVIPVTFSLTASHVSGLTLLALPADVYRFGAAYWLIGICLILVCIVTASIFLPVFCKLNITSTYEYLVKRFDNQTRMLASFLFAISTFFLLPVVIYVPALAFSAATGFSVTVVAPFVCGVCIFYTVLGGMKAIVWTDTLQFSVTTLVSITVYALGLISTGGFLNVWNIAVKGQRLDVFDFDPDPTKRDTFWALIIGFTTQFISITAVNQGTVQKLLSVATLREAKLTVWLYALGLTLFKTLSVLTGFIIYARYGTCDPLTTGKIKRNDQLMPYYVMDVAGKLPGLPGLFIAGVFNGTLSALSANLNSLAGTIYEDFVLQYMPKNTTEKTHSSMIKLLVIIIGVLCTSMVFIVQNLGGVLPLAIALLALPAGPLLGLFILGVLIPRANSKGTFYGGIIGFLLISCISFGAQYYQAIGAVGYEPKPLSTDGCSLSENATTFVHETFASSHLVQPFVLFRISYYYHSLIGTVLTVIFGYVISLFTEKDAMPVNPDFVSPMVHFLIPKKAEIRLSGKEYTTVENAMHIISLNEKSKDINDAII